MYIAICMCKRPSRCRLGFQYYHCPGYGMWGAREGDICPHCNEPVQPARLIPDIVLHSVAEPRIELRARRL